MPRTRWRGRRPEAALTGSHEQLDVAECGIAIDDVDPLQLDLERAVDHDQRVRGPGRVKVLLVEPRLDIVHRRPGDIFVCRLVAAVDLRCLQYMMATALGFLRE